MFRVPSNLSQYVDFDNGKLLIADDIPKELEEDVKELEIAYKAIHKKGDLTEY